MGFLKKTFRSVKKFVSNPGRVVSAAATLGASEVLRAGMKAVMPGLPKLQTLPTTPDIGDADAAAEEERRRLQGARGRASTILTGGQGLLNAPTLSSRTLLGG